MKYATFQIVLIIFCLIISTPAAADSRQSNDLVIQDPSSWDFAVVNHSTSMPNGNETISDGDHISISISVNNPSSDLINGSWELKILSNGIWYTSMSQQESWPQGQEKVSEITLGPLSEGTYSFKFEILTNNSSSSISKITEVIVGPNPIIFSSAGDAVIAITGEPANVGDTLTASILVKNEGTEQGTVLLRLSHSNDTIIHNGEYVSISPGSSREVSADFNFLSSGNKEMTWQVISDIGGVSTSLIGSHTITILPQQDSQLGVYSNEWVIDSGLHISYWIMLSDGPSRQVEVSISEYVKGSFYELQKFSVLLNQGVRNLDLQISDPSIESDKIRISLTPIGWSSEQLPFLEIDLIRPIPIVDISSCIQDPEIVDISAVLVVECTISNSGNSKTLPGEITLSRVSDGMIFQESRLSLTSLSAGESRNFTMSVQNWQDEGSTALQVKFSSGSNHALGNISIQANQKPSDEFKLPFDTTAALLGALSGLVLMMVLLAFWRVATERTPTTANGNSAPISRIEKRREIDNIEASCPTCSQRLSIPGDHVGRVRCPACSNSFEVGVKKVAKVIENTSIKSNSEVLEKPINSALRSSSTDDILPCPSCDQLLKVPLEKRPVMSRCPACRGEFMALRGD